MTNRVKKTKSPLKSKPLRHAGQSLDEEIQRVLDDEVLSYVYWPSVAAVLAGLEWWRWFKPMPPAPILYTVLAVLTICFSTYKLIRLRKRVHKLKLGRDGEKAVGQYLELLREKGFKVYHDVIGEGFNIDHVLVSEKGVFAIETKTYSKPEKGAANILYDGKTLKMNGFELGDVVLSQARAEAQWLSSLIKESTGKSNSVKPVVLFPGWFVESVGEANNSGLWVLNPKALPHFLSNLPNVLSAEDAQLTAFHLSRYIRTKADS